MNTQLRKIQLEGKQYYEVRYRKSSLDKWNYADIHSDLREADKQRNHIEQQPKYNTECGCGVSTKKNLFQCNKCQKLFCPSHIYSYVDGNNIAITKNAPNYCKDCYFITYNTYE